MMMKVGKAKSKARDWTIQILISLSCYCVYFGVDYAWISLFSRFKVIKVKKAALIAGVAFLHIGLFLFLKVLL